MCRAGATARRAPDRVGGDPDPDRGSDRAGDDQPARMPQRPGDRVASPRRDAGEPGAEASLESGGDGGKAEREPHGIGELHDAPVGRRHTGRGRGDARREAVEEALHGIVDPFGRGGSMGSRHVNR